MQRLIRSALASLLLTPGACIARSAPAISTPEREGYLPGWSGARIHYRVLGSGPDTIVAVHGGPGAGMQAILPELRPLAGSHTVIFYDQRGGGRSELPSDTTLLGATEHVQDLEAVRRFFKLQKLTLVAHSFGSVLVARYAQDFPDRIERMVFFGAVGPRRAEAAQQAMASALAADSALQARLLAVMRALMGGSAADPVVACREYEAIGRQIAIARGESGNWKGTTCAMPPEAVRYYYRYTARLGPQGFGDWDFSHSLRHVHAPLLVIAGDQDPGSLNVQRAWAAALPLGRLFVIPGGGKTSSADRPDLFFPAVETFLAGRWPATAEATATPRQPLTLAELLPQNAEAMGGRGRLDTLRSVVTLRNRTSLTSLKVPQEVSGVFDVVGAGPPVEDRGISRGAAWGDCDDDGYPDLFVARPTYDGPIQANALYRNATGRGFLRLQNDATTERAAGWEGGVWVDVDGDGDLDLHVVGRNGAGSVLYRNIGGCGLTRVEPDPLAGRVSSASMACWADVDGDGLLDVFVVGSGEGRNTLFRNMGSWRFEHVELSDLAAGAGASRACAFGDLDGDGLPELAVVNARQPNLLLRNRGGMSLVPDTTAPLWRDTAYGYGVSWADVNGDGIRDLFVANFDAGNSLYTGRLDGTLEPVALGDQLQSPASKGHAWGDFDLDGQLDLYLGSGTPRPGMVNQLYLGEGSGRFRLETKGEFATHADTSAAVAAADYDLDGALDLFVANWGSANSVNRLYRNISAERAWLKVRLEGVRSNRMGVGVRASVLVTSGHEHRWLHRWLDASTGYAGQNEPVLHFGLGDAEHVDSLLVLWPSGALDRFGVVPVRATVAVTEGSATLKVCALPLTPPNASPFCGRNQYSVEMFKTEPGGTP